MYGTITDWRAYALARGDSAPTEADANDATAALTRSSDMVRLRYVPNFLPGYGITTQPTGYDYPIVEEASYIAASIELAKPGFFAKTYTASEQKVLTEVKGIKWTIVGDASKTYGAMPVSTLVDAMFEPYVSNPDDQSFMFQTIGPTYE